MDLADIINLDDCPLEDEKFKADCKNTLDKDGVLVLNNFLRAGMLERVRREGQDNQDKAYFCVQKHNVYLTPSDPDYPENHSRNRKVISSKGCITDDQIPPTSPLHVLYDSNIFRSFLCAVLDEKNLYDYADSLSSINLHYASEGQELGWHFDNSSFATTMLIQKPTSGGAFEYVENVRDADKGEMNFDGISKILDGKTDTKIMAMNEGTLVLFRGRNALHRVTPTIGERTRMLVVFAYNSEPGIAISESASMTFYGRVG